MKKFFSHLWNFFKKPWVLWTLLLIFLIVLVWMISNHVNFIRSVRVYIILFLVMLWGVNNLRLQHKKSTEQEIPTDPEYTPEEYEMMHKEVNDTFLAAIATLPKPSFFQAPFFRRTHETPWFIMLGAENVGKTTSLLNSNLNFSVESNNASVPDNYFSWRYSPMGTFLDCRGNLIIHDRETDNLDKAAWQETLHLIRKYRYRRSFTGIMLSLSLEDLLNKTEEELALQAYNLNKALQDLERVMGFQCPVYVQMTKTDLLNGFKEFADLLTVEDQQQGIGFSLPNDAYPLQHFPKKFNALIDALVSKTLLSLHHETNPQKAAAAALFPSELQELKKRLERYLSLLFESNQYRERGFFRGLFFVSALFGTKVQQNLLQPYINEFGLRLRAPNYLINTKAAYFIDGMYQRFILAEHNVYRFSYMTLREWLVRNGFLLLTAFALWGGIFYLLLQSYEQNAFKLEELNKSAQRYMLNLREANSNVDQRNIQLRLLSEMDRIFRPETDELSMHWGLYQGYKVGDALDQFYLPVLQDQFLPILLDTIKGVLRDPQASSGQVYDFLRAYLMLGDHTYLDANFIERLLENKWNDDYADQPEVHALLSATIISYFHRKIPEIKIEPDLVNFARNRLRDITPSEQIYSQLNSLNYGENYSLTAASGRDFNKVFNVTQAATSIPALFTLSGYNSGYKQGVDQLLASINDNDWVLGAKAQQDITPDQVAGIKQRVYSMYMNQYVATWKHALYSLQVMPFGSLPEAQNILNLLSQKNSVFENILMAVNQNTILMPGDKLPPPGASKSLFDSKKAVNAASRGTSGAKSMVNTANIVKNAGAITSAVKDLTSNKDRSIVGSSFYDVNQLTIEGPDGDRPYFQVQDALMGLSDYVNDIVGAADPVKAAYTAAAAHAASMAGAGGGGGEGASISAAAGAGGDDPLTIIVKLANQSPEPLRHWLLDIEQNTWNAILKNAVTYLNEEWVISVYPQYDELFSNYPFDKNSLTDLDPNNFVEFIKKGGIFDKFITTFLKNFVNTNASPWQLTSIDGAVLPINVQRLYTMSQLQTVFLGKGDGKQPSVSFSVTSTQLDNSLFMAQLKVGDKVYSALHGPQIPDLMTWVADPSTIASVQMTSINRAVTSVSKSGNWALMKLLDTAELSARDNLTIVAKFTLYGKTVTYVIRTSAPMNPFNLARLRAVTLSRNL